MAVSTPLPASQCLPPLMPIVLPALTHFSLEGPTEYLEDLVARIETPLLDDGHLGLYGDPIFDNPRVPCFIHRTKMFKLLDSRCTILDSRRFVLTSLFNQSCKVSLDIPVHWVTHTGCADGADLHTVPDQLFSCRMARTRWVSFLGTSEGTFDVVAGIPSPIYRYADSASLWQRDSVSCCTYAGRRHRGESYRSVARPQYHCVELSTEKGV